MEWSNIPIIVVRCLLRCVSFIFFQINRAFVTETKMPPDCCSGFYLLDRTGGFIDTFFPIRHTNFNFIYCSQSSSSHELFFEK